MKSITNKEKRVQRALGLMRQYDVLIHHHKSTEYFRIEAESLEVAREKALYLSKKKKYNRTGVEPATWNVRICERS